MNSANKKRALTDWLQMPCSRLAILSIAACLSLPAEFFSPIRIGLDDSWQLSLQLATAEHKVFGKEFVFTYGPLGYLLIRAPVYKLPMLLYDLFVLGSLLSLYRQLLPERPRLFDALFVIALAAVTKLLLIPAAATVLFTILCYWLWRVYKDNGSVAISLSLLSATVLFFGKINYGLVVVFLVPAYGLGLAVLRRDRRVAGVFLTFGFPLLLIFAAIILHVNLPGYLRSGFELTVGYNEAMLRPPSKSSLSFGLACLFLLAMGLVAIVQRRRLPWTDQAMLLPVIALASALLFKNAFGRTDEMHISAFYQGLPLILGIWCIAWRRETTIRSLLILSLLYPLAVLIENTRHLSREELVQSLPLRYLEQAYNSPWSRNSVWLRDNLRAKYPTEVIPSEISSSFDGATADAMPWESSIAIANGFKLKQRPIFQSYCVYTSWLDSLNARFLASEDAPEYMLYACAQNPSIDERPSAWDESISKRVLLEHYVFDSEFPLGLRVWLSQELASAPVFRLKRAAQHRFVQIASREVSLTLNEPLPLPTTKNFVFLTLNVERTMLGQISGLLLWPKRLRVRFDYEDGTSKDFRAVIPILRTGVLVNRRVEAPDEIRNWLKLQGEKNLGVSSVTFKSASGAWAFRPRFKGTLTEYALE